MAKLIYFTPASLDDYIADGGGFEWSAPGEEVFAFITALVRPIGAYLYGRKTYETMSVWQTPEVIPTLAAEAIRAALVDEVHLLVVPALLGEGIRVLPSGVAQKLDLLDERRFANAWVYLRDRTLS